ncbi:MAG: EamA family transporter [Bacteroidota bacterium]
MKYKGTERLLIYASFASIYIFWGSTYLAVKIAVQSIPPFLMGGIRFVIAGVILLTFTRIFWQPPLPSFKQIGNAALVGTLFLGVGTGSVAWALQYVDSGIVALIISAQPLLTMLLVWVMLKKPPAASSYLGIFLGMLGMYLLVTQNYVTDAKNSWWGILAVIMSMFAWGYSSVYIKKADMPKGQAQNASIQMLAGSLSLFLFSLFIGDYKGFELVDVNQSAVFAILFLVIFGSIIGFSSFNYLLQRISPEKVATSTYVNPIVAMFLGWWLGGEMITVQSMIAALVMLTGVLFINVDMFDFLKKMGVRNRLVKS